MFMLLGEGSKICPCCWESAARCCSCRNGRRRITRAAIDKGKRKKKKRGQQLGCCWEKQRKESRKEEKKKKGSQRMNDGCGKATYVEEGKKKRGDRKQGFFFIFKFLTYRPANRFHTLCKNLEVLGRCSLHSPVLPYSLSFFRDNIHLSFKQLFKSSAVSEAEAALSSYNSFCNNLPRQPVWALAENYRFEPAFVESRKLLNSIGDMMHVQVIIEGSMNSKNPYFSSSWRRNFIGGFILDMGVHFIAGLRMIVGCEINMVSAITRHVDTTLPPPDNICSLFQLENGCAGVFVMAVNSTSPKIYWRIDGSKGALQIERDIDNGRHGYSVRFYTAGGHCQSTFYPFSGVNEELKSFIADVLQTNNKEGSSSHNPEARSSYIEGARDVAVLEAMLESSMKQGNPVHVKRL